MAKEAPKDVRAAEAAENRAEAAQGQTPGKRSKAAKEPVYPAGEFAASAKKIFGTRPECVITALKAAGKPECTVSEAEEIVEKFLKREVR